MENFLYGVLVVLVFYILYMIFFTCIKPRFALNDIFGLEFNVCDMKDLSSKNWKQLKEWISIIVYIGVFYIACTTFLIEGYQIPSQSMYPTFNGDKNPLIGDRIFALKGIHWIKPFKRGDIVIFISMEDYKTFIVKRLIGLPGDTIELKNNRVYVNGKPFSHRRYSKDYIKQIKTPYALNGVINDPSDLTEELRKDLRKRFLREEKKCFGFDKYVVPKDYYFVMGDNTDSSNDSRYWGPLAKRNILGRASLIWWPIKRGKILK